jgi:hypothetical protein
MTTLQRLFRAVLECRGADPLAVAQFADALEEAGRAEVAAAYRWAASCRVFPKLGCHTSAPPLRVGRRFHGWGLLMPADPDAGSDGFRVAPEIWDAVPLVPAGGVHRAFRRLAASLASLEKKEVAGG